MVDIKLLSERIIFRALLLLYGRSIFDEVLGDTKRKEWEAFPSSDVWRDEISRWLTFLKLQKQLNRFYPRLNSSPTKRNETLAEILCSYFMQMKLGFRIADWEVETANRQNVEFVIKNRAERIYCEVKSPQWEGELSPSERDAGRKKLPKYLHAEVRTYSNNGKVQYAIKKAYSKFLPNTKNLLIVNDNLFVSLIDSSDDIENALYDIDDGYFSNSKFENLGGLLVLECSLSDRINYRHNFYKNNFAIKSINCIK